MINIKIFKKYIFAYFYGTLLAKFIGKSHQ